MGNSLRQPRTFFKTVLGTPKIFHKRIMEDAREHRESPKKQKTAPSYQDEKTRYHLTSSPRKRKIPKKTLFASGNGLTRQVLNAETSAAHTHRLTGDLLPLPQGLAPTVPSLRGHGKTPPDQRQKAIARAPGDAQTITR